MGKVEGHRADLAPLLAGQAETLRAYLLAGSNLPGPRGNLELAEAFAREVAAWAGTAPQAAWSLSLALAEEGAPTGDPGEFLAFCGARGIGALGAALPERTGQALTRLHTLAQDERWRLREAVAMALQDLLWRRREETLAALAAWVQGEDWLAMRAVAAGLADPPLLAEAALAREALALHRRICEAVLAARDRKAAALKALRQGLGYTLSVVVAAAPAEGFALMEELAARPDADMAWVLRENLKKNRLAKPFAAEVARLKARPCPVK